MQPKQFQGDGADPLQAYLRDLYPQEDVTCLHQQLIKILEDHAHQPGCTPKHKTPLSHQDVILIAYPDQVQSDSATPLEALDRFLDAHLSEYVSGVHILPFFPYSSDDGFSVIDFKTVRPDLGEWSHIQSIARNNRLMVDLVINHVSAQGQWFKNFLAGDPKYQDFFISLSPDTDLSNVVRPRDLPLLTPVETPSGRKHVWTTFSADQVDLNFANPRVLFEMLEVLLLYVRNGAQIIRLDAIAFLWKEAGSPSIHLPQTHLVVKLLREALQRVSPWVLLLTETNVPHKENLSYFGDGDDEAHMVYQFALPPLTLHTLLSGDSRQLTQWASNLTLPSSTTTFFNFLASHDGIGLRPAQDLLDAHSIDRLLEWVEKREGHVSWRSLADGSRAPYELNITLFDSLADEVEATEITATWIARYLSAQAIMLSLQGVPGIYFHSLFGGRNYLEGVEATGQKRTINREKFCYDDLELLLTDPTSHSSRVFQGFAQLLTTRRLHEAFNPYSQQKILDIDPAIFAVLRSSAETGRRIMCIHNVTGLDQTLRAAKIKIDISSGIDLISGEVINSDGLTLRPYQSYWISL
jgi:sucrose phosphorylase